MLKIGLFFVATLATGCVSVPAEPSAPTTNRPSASPASRVTGEPPLATPGLTVAPSTVEPTANPTEGQTLAPTQPTTPEPVTTPAQLPTSSPTQATTFTPSLAPGAEFFAPVWQDPGVCTFEDTETLYGWNGREGLIVGSCNDTDGTTAMAWRSKDGFEWSRLWSRTRSAYATGATSSFDGSAVIVGTSGDSVPAAPLVWEPKGDGDAFKLTELPTASPVDTWADQIATGMRSYMIVGNAYPFGPDGATSPMAWLKVVDEAGWVIVEPPSDAEQFVDIADSSVFRDGTVEPRLLLGQPGGYVGDRYEVLGYTKDREPAVWTYTIDGKWKTTVLPGGDHDLELREIIDQWTALSTDTIWTRHGLDWTATDLGEHFASAYAGIHTDTATDSMLMITGTQWDDGDEYSHPEFIASEDGTDWTLLNDQPKYFDLIDSISDLEEHVVAISEQQVYLGPLPRPSSP
jgi:hypothetical protein